MTTDPKGFTTASGRTTGDVDTNAPMTTALGTVELLEQILSQAPASTVFVAQLTSRFWRDVVASSIMLQRKMFLLAPTMECAERWGLAMMPPESDHTHPCSVLCVTDMSDLPANLAPANPGQPALSQPARYLNPLLRRNMSKESAVLPLSYRLYWGEHVILQLTNTLVFKSAAWKRTYLTEFPCSVASVHFSWAIPGTANRMLGASLRFQEVTTTVPGGFTLGSLLEASLDEMIDHWYHHGSEGWGTCKLSLRDSLLQRESETGNKAVLETMYITMKDIVLPQDGEWDIVER
ncbi:hypothetical protein LTR91_007977 [Friedmanniomyces endolithicus]|uniref:F-box domain-containing protein n=1 Tax=Friedmanniomyces endolithicus TaxID=329885 RepID=A0AAN6J2Y4_9PEZI|nr:hypothetical protein LTR35_003092 [Friedmanniomyces endolithicus]KAK0300462.1 hypothetical protein LTS00_000717 [Friedmanniomyces endolithicus]KAK0312240.1 hypothetical protein LTR82_014036 [Friedmanniomyces endolithicus]KAK0925382.1 hypothetical protein LTR57_005033 [Friedmanniomyces endolithicus]KAK0993622.1 hypothetical protein LTR91_007977 [Friedmanniomyces endolithicus]